MIRLLSARAFKSTNYLVITTALVLLTGCASTPPLATLEPDAKISVLMLPPTVDDDSLRRNFHNKEKNIPPAIFAADRLQLEEKVEDALRQALKNANLPQLNTASVSRSSDPDLIPIGKPLNAAELTVLQKLHPADAYLRIEVTDYGQTPRSWTGAYVGFEVVTTLALAGILYIHPTTRPLAGVYLIQEGVEELSEGYSGLWLINRLSRPVRIEADLVDGKTGVVLWHDSETGMTDWHWKNLWHMDDKIRDSLLQHSTDKAMDDLVKELERK